jgi:alkaline phosphatase
MKKIISFVLGLCMTLSLGVGTLSGCAPKREFKNIILVIGDGMGENHILNTIEYFDLETPAFMADQAGYIGTTSKNGVTDSAAAGTALATGNKVENGELALHKNKELEQITTIAQKAKMKTGVITTDTLDGATPAAFTAQTR